MNSNIITRERALELKKKFESNEEDEEEYPKVSKEVCQAVRSILAQHHLKRLAIPSWIWGNQSIVIEKDYFDAFFKFTNYYDNKKINRWEYDDFFISPSDILLKMLDAIEYYEQNNIQKSDWGGETELTRMLRWEEEEFEKVIIPEKEENILGSKCKVLTNVNIYSYAGIRISTYINFNDTYRTYKSTAYFDEEDEFPFDTIIVLECGVHGIAKLIDHYKVPTNFDNVQPILESLAEAMENEAVTKNFRSSKDFYPLFKQLDIDFRILCDNKVEGDFFNYDLDPVDDLDPIVHDNPETENILFDEGGFEDIL